MTILLLLGLAPAYRYLFATSHDSMDLSWLADFATAAPFAALAFWQMVRAQSRLEAQEAKHETEVDRLHAKIEELQKAALNREQQLVAGLGPRIYDAALLYEKTTEVAKRAVQPPSVLPPAAPASVDHRLDELTELVGRLVAGMGEDGHAGDHG